MAKGSPMIFTLLTGFAVGAVFEQAVPTVRDLSARAGLSLAPDTLKLVSFALTLAALALVLALLDVEPRPALLLIAAALGVARKPLLARFKDR